MPYRLHSLTTPDHLPTLITIFDAAFIDHPFIPHLFPAISPAAHIANYEDEWARREVEGLRWFFITDDGKGDEIVAWAKWVVPHAFGEEEKKRMEGEGEIGGWPEGANVGLCEEFFGNLREGRRRWVGEGEYFLNTLAVHPSHHRKGLGSLLIKAGLDLADRDGARTFIEASAQGLPLYLRHGWEPVGAAEIDMRKYGGTEVVREERLIRLPKLKK